MKVMTTEEINARLGFDFFKAWDDGDWSRLSASFSTYPDCGRLNVLAKTLAQTINQPNGSILIIEQMGVFPSSENPFLAAALRLTEGEKRSIIDAPAHLFLPHEDEVCWSIVQVCLINFWDFLLVSHDKRVCVHGSHDERMELFSLDNGEFSRVEAALRAIGF